MRYMVVLLAAGLTVVSEASKEECIKLTGLHPASRLCCKKPIFMFEEKYEDMKECFALRGKRNCDLDICIATKKGISTGSGKIDRKAYEEEIEKTFDVDHEMVESMKKNCINGDVTMFGKPYDCELAKIRHCIHTNMLLFCREFEETGPCTGLKELVEECKS